MNEESVDINRSSSFIRCNKMRPPLVGIVVREGQEGGGSAPWPGAVKNVSIGIMYPCISRSQFHDIHAVNKHHFFKSMVKFSNLLFLMIYENIRKIKGLFFISTRPRWIMVTGLSSGLLNCFLKILRIENHEVWNTKCVLDK